MAGNAPQLRDWSNPNSITPTSVRHPRDTCHGDVSGKSATCHEDVTGKFRCSNFPNHRNMSIWFGEMPYEVGDEIWERARHDTTNGLRHIADLSRGETVKSPTSPFLVPRTSRRSRRNVIWALPLRTVRRQTQLTI